MNWTIENQLKGGILLFGWLEHAWTCYIGHRQYKILKNTQKAPELLKDIITSEEFEKARAYAIDKSNFILCKETISLVVSSIGLVCGFYGFIWHNLDGKYGMSNEILHSIAWTLVMSLISLTVSMPFSIYSNFVVEEKHGFNKQTIGFFICDEIKKFILMQLLGALVIALVIFIVQSGGDYFFLWLWLFAFILTIVLLTIYPEYIAPLFDNYTALPAGELKQAIENLAAQLEFPLGKLYVVEGSKRSAHSNAYFYGVFGLKRIVLFDTLMGTDEKKGCTNEEILAILAHELGHWKSNHFIKNLVIVQLNMLLLFSVFGYMFHYEPLYTSMGLAPGCKPIFIGLVAVMQFVLAPFNTLLQFAMNALSRHFEYEADAFAASLGKAKLLQQSLIQLNKDNLAFPLYDSWYSSWHHSHPTVLDRISALNKKAN